MAAPNFSICDQEGGRRLIADTPPNHYILKIQQFSLLAKHNIERYTSTDFQAGGYKWKLVLYPNGNKTRGVNDHISLYLLLVDATASSLGPCGHIRANFRFFLLDQNKDVYLTLQDASENGRRFHRMNHEWGFDNFISQADFKNSANGYLVNDTCVFGADVYVCQERLATGRGECLSMLKDTVNYKNTWRIDNFSGLSLTNEVCVDSKPFTVADKSWKIQLYPQGKGNGAGSYMSLYLTLVEPESLPPAYTIYVEFTLRVLDQVNHNHYFGNGHYWFSASNSTSGWPRFVSHSYLNRLTTGLVVKNSCLVEAEVVVKGVANLL